METKRKKQVFLFLFLFLFIKLATFSESAYSARQLVQAGHWVYDAMEKMFLENAMCNIFDNAPMSVGELRLYFSRVNYEKLSKSGRLLYRDVYAYLYDTKKTWKNGKFSFSGAFFAFNIFLNPQVLFKSNDNIDWSITTDYTGHIPHKACYKMASDYPAGKMYTYPLDKKYITEDAAHYHENGGEYGTEGTFNNTALYDNPLGSLPLFLGFGDAFIIETDLSFTKNYWGMNGDYNFMDIPLSTEDIDFYTPRVAYGSAGWTFDKWGIEVNMGRSGLEIGHSLTGSVIYNRSFNTQFYFQLNVYCQYMRYNLDVVQIQKDKFLYLHQIDVTPFKFIKISLIEGTLINEPFELRFLNPLMIMHSFTAWEDYSDEKEEAIYGESHVCAYLGVTLDIVPCKNFRIYALYAQNEMQTPFEKNTDSGVAIPDGFGWQVGFEVKIPERHGGFFSTALEGIYTTPFLYVKQGADWSLFSKRYDNLAKTDTPLYSWVGTPFGPDAVGFEARLDYEFEHKWEASFNYLFLAHGTNSFGMFDAYYTDIDGEKFSAYYPSVLRHIGILSSDEAGNIAQDHKLTGSVQFTNNITLSGYYKFNNHFKLSGNFSYLFIFNNKNEEGAFETGVELGAYLTYNVF